MAPAYRWETRSSLPQDIKRCGTVHALVEEIVAKRGNPNVCVAGTSLLRIAATRNDYRAVRALLDYGADPNGKCGKRYSPPIVGAGACPACIEALLQHGADVNAQDIHFLHGYSVLHNAMVGIDTCTDQERANRFKVIEMAMDAGADPALQINAGANAFDVAKTCKCSERLLELLSHQPTLDEPSPDASSFFSRDFSRIASSDLTRRQRDDFEKLPFRDQAQILRAGNDIVVTVRYLTEEEIKSGATEVLQSVTTQGEIIFADPSIGRGFDGVKSLATLRRRLDKHCEADLPPSRKEVFGRAVAIVTNFENPQDKPHDLNAFDIDFRGSIAVRGLGFPTYLLMEGLSAGRVGTGGISTVAAEATRIASTLDQPCKIFFVGTGVVLLYLAQPVASGDDMAVTLEARFRLDDARSRAIDAHIDAADAAMAAMSAWADWGASVLRIDVPSD